MKALPAETVRLLCSSQVITSVLNVVKELVENSLDAGSSSLEVKLDNYGLDRIEVRDNGSGIKATDVPVMAVKHYTSKISCHEDLERLETYGFRGEALASICAISEVVITTKTADDDFSIQYSVDHNGQIISQKPSHLGEGTTVCAANLFKNLPVRRQYYSNTKKCKEELKRVQNLLMAYAVVKPELRITLSHNKAVVWQKSRVSDHRTALMAVLGAASVANMLPVQHHQEQPEIGIDGFFPKPGSDCNSTSSSTPDKTFIFVNSRPVHHKEILKLIKQYYTSAQSNKESANRRYPFSMMNITIPASTVDINLTPDKTEVMLQNKEGVLLAVETMLISLYGYSIDNDDLKTGGNPVSSADVPEHTNVVSTPTTDVSLDEPELLEISPTNADKQDGELSLSNTANTSSSSISEDWVINRTSSDFDSINSSLPADDVVLNSTADLNCNSPKASKSDSGPSQESEVSAESWSTGKAFSNQVTGECLEPVQLHVPKAHEDLGGNMRSSPSKRPSNVIMEKMAKLTAYELISNRSVRQPSSAFSLFEQDTRSQVLQENPRASPQDVTTAVKERWESLGEEDRKKVLGGPEYMDVLLNMEKDSARFNGDIYFTDPRLVANGFEIKMIPGSSSSERHVEVMGMADCMPFFGIGDLREILQAIKVRDAKTVKQCRPLKVSNYLESEAVRLARQLPLNLTRADVTNTLCRMKQELEEESQACIHRRPFFHELVTVPETEQDALQIMSNTC
ncbi:PMS1 protein homolog 1 isoform X2 [Carassius gibelio]|uniref:PMS1 protein homolog 1 isoform X2 n=1 Tax=Carassius gibelio TaxID=101364 RepID=UPI002279547C|nr:PMS1 protein homolog 1 isoform X2 [Carassius gibelio]